MQFHLSRKLVELDCSFGYKYILRMVGIKVERRLRTGGSGGYSWRQSIRGEPQTTEFGRQKKSHMRRTFRLYSAGVTGLVCSSFAYHLPVYNLSSHLHSDESTGKSKLRISYSESCHTRYRRVHIAI